MTRDTIIKLAREADAAHDNVQVTPFLERFAALVAAEVGIAQWHRGFAEGQAAEREACAKVCDAASEPRRGYDQTDEQWAASTLAERIRARSNHDSAARHP